MGKHRLPTFQLLYSQSCFPAPGNFFPTFAIVSQPLDQGYSDACLFHGTYFSNKSPRILFSRLFMLTETAGDFFEQLSQVIFGQESVSNLTDRQIRVGSWNSSPIISCIGIFVQARNSDDGCWRVNNCLAREYGVDISRCPWGFKPKRH